MQGDPAVVSRRGKLVRFALAQLLWASLKGLPLLFDFEDGLGMTPPGLLGIVRPKAYLFERLADEGAQPDRHSFADIVDAAVGMFPGAGHWQRHMYHPNVPVGPYETVAPQQLTVIVGLSANLAERGGFEPPMPLRACRISSAVQSTALPPLRQRFQRLSVSTVVPIECTYSNRCTPRHERAYSGSRPGWQGKGDYLFKQANSANWYIKFQYPPEVAEVVGKREIVISTGISDRGKDEAIELPHELKHRAIMLAYKAHKHEKHFGLTGTEGQVAT